MTGWATHLGKLKQFITYTLVGLVNTFVGLGVIYICSEILKVHYVLANVAGYAVGLLVAFFTHRGVTFRREGKEGSPRQQAALFLVVFAVSFTVQLGVLVALHHAGIVDFLAQVIAIGVYMVVGFIGHKYLTFRIPGGKTPE